MSKETSSSSWVLPVRAIPNGKKNEVIGWEQNALKIKVQAVPEDGKANKELIRFLSKTTKRPKSSFELISGEKARHKKLSIRGIEQTHFFESVGVTLPENYWK